MSGIEVASLILGAFPILIASLEHYRESAKVLKNWWRFEREHNNFKYEVEYQQRRFEQNLEMYLLPLVTDDDQLLKSLLANPDGPEWKDKQLEERLKKRILGNYDLYMQTIKAMNTVTGQLREKLRLGESGSRYEIRRLIFCFDESPRNELLEKLDKYNDRLRELLSMSDGVASLKRVQGAERTSRGLLQLWHHANAVYDLLKGAWRCPCRHSHQANLLLEHRTNAEVDFSVLFHFGDNAGKPDSRLWVWQNTNIKLFKKDPSAAAVALTAPQHISMVDCQSSSSAAQAREIRSRGVENPISALKLPAASPPSVRRRVTVADPAAHTTSPSGNGNDLTEITDLCSAMAGCRSTSHYVGLLKGDENHYSVFPVLKIPASADVREAVTLEAILSKSLLTRRERYLIALALVSSHLQLHSTPWLGSQWKKRDIVAIRDMNNPSQVFTDQFYISHNFVPGSASTLSAPASSDFSFSTLGIMLLELCFGTPFEGYAFRQQFPSTDPDLEPILDHAAAKRWCESVSDETGPEYADAISWCLDQTYSRKDQWRQEFVQEVIEPIRGCYAQLAGAGSS